MPLVLALPGAGRENDSVEYVLTWRFDFSEVSVFGICMNDVGVASPERTESIQIELLF